MKSHRFERTLSLLVASVVAIGLSLPAAAEDIDIFVGGAGGSSAANVLIIIDNTSNWADSAQHWPGGEVQGQAEIAALIQVIPTLSDAVNVGLMLFNQNGSGSCCSGGYIRYAMQPMTAANKTALLAELNNLLANFSSPLNKAASSASYSMALFDAFKYFGGYTSPAHATDGVAGTPQNATAFGTAVFATPASTFNRPDPLGYTDLTDTVYRTPAAAADACGGKNYIIFVGNGFPNTDTPPSENLKTFLEGVGGNSAQIRLPVLTTTTSTASTNLGPSAACYNNNASGLSSCTTASAGLCGTGYDTCACGAPTTATGCTGSKVKYAILGGVTTTTVTPTGTTALPAGSKTRYADEWTRFLYLTDVNAAPGQQNVTTFTIDAFNAKQDADQTSLLYSMASAGGGQYYAAKNRNELIVDFGDIFAKIQASNNTFVSASLPVNANPTSRSVSLNEVYIGMFRPDASARPLWNGNMKRYKIGNFSGKYNLADASGASAVSTLTGFFDDCATSWWTSDSNKYWWAVISDPPPAGACPASTKNTFDKFSDAPDGPKVEKGSVAEIIRRGNNPSATSTWALNRTMYTKSFVPFTVANTGMTTTDVDFIKGTSVDATGNYLTYQFDPTDSSKTTTIRPTIHGDVVHSRPVPINYISNQTVVYYGANDGGLHAVDGSNGQELWAYVAEEFYSTLPRLRQNSPLINYSFLDPISMSPPPLPKNYYFDGSIGAYQPVDNTKVWIYPTMRRGGRMVYALDVSNPSAPSLKWKFGCPNLTDDFGCVGTSAASIGQTWSAPNIAGLKVGGTVGETPTTIVAVGGGYDNCEDGAPNATCSGAKGSIVYFLNADTGSKLASFTTTGRVVADVAFVDLDGDGIPDLAYVVDTRGGIYRIGFGFSKTAPLVAAAWTSTKVAAVTGSDKGTAPNRKFLYAPALLPVADQSNGSYYVYVGVGSGDREQPLETQYPYANPVTNRFYVFLDNLASTSTADLDNPTKMSDFSTVTSCSTSGVVPNSSKSGWFMDLNAFGRGEQTVTSAAIVGGAIVFSTNRPIPRSANACAPLGEARGYAVNLFNASGVIGVQPNECGGTRTGIFAGGGLPPSPVVVNVNVDGKVVTIGIGVIDLDGNASAGVQAAQVFTLPPQKRKRVYWRQEGDN